MKKNNVMPRWLVWVIRGYLAAIFLVIFNKFEYISTNFSSYKESGGFSFHWRQRKRHRVLKMKNRGIEIHVVDKQRMLKECSCENGCRDDFGVMHNGSASSACAVHTKNPKDPVSIWIQEDDVSPVLMHELCHADVSYSPAECEKMF